MLIDNVLSLSKKFPLEFNYRITGKIITDIKSFLSLADKARILTYKIRVTKVEDFVRSHIPYIGLNEF